MIAASPIREFCFNRAHQVMNFFTNIVSHLKARSLERVYSFRAEDITVALQKTRKGTLRNSHWKQLAISVIGLEKKLTETHHAFQSKSHQSCSIQLYFPPYDCIHRCHIPSTQVCHIPSGILRKLHSVFFFRPATDLKNSRILFEIDQNKKMPLPATKSFSCP